MCKNENTTQLCRQIETIRSKMNSLIELHEDNLLHPEIVRLSQLLDQLLLEYHRTIQ